MLELTKGNRPWAQTEMTKFIAFLFRSKVNVKFGHFISFRSSCAGTAKKCTKKRAARAKLLFYTLNLLLF